jgi:hypothetical protein
MDDGKEVVLSIDSAEEAIELIQQLEAGLEMSFPDRIEFKGDLGKLIINIQGEKYHSTVPGNFARGIWEFQQEVYRAVAIAINGNGDLRKLPKDVLEQYNLVFKVSEGSSHLEAGTSGFFTSLGKGLSDMSDGKKLAAIIGIALIFSMGAPVATIGTAYVSGHFNSKGVESSAGVEKARIEADQAKEEERTKQIQSLVSTIPVVKEFSEAVASGTKQVIKSVPDATAAHIAGESFDRQDIIDINSRASREARDSIDLVQEFKIIGFKRPEGSDIGRYTLASRSGEISAILDMSTDGPFSEEQIQHFWKAGLSQSPILLTVEAKTVDGQIKQAFISEIYLPDDSGVTPHPNL